MQLTNPTRIYTKTESAPYFLSLLYVGGPSLLIGRRYKWLDLTLGRTRSGSRYVIGHYSHCFTLRNRIPEFNKKRKHTIVSGSNIYLALNMPFLPPLKFKWITTCMILSSETPFLAYAYICFLTACIFSLASLFLIFKHKIFVGLLSLVS